MVECAVNAVTEAMALAEGENETQKAWRLDHRGHVERNEGLSQDMPVVWEGFVRIGDLTRSP